MTTTVSLNDHDRGMIRLGAICGILGMACYLSAVTGVLPDTAARLAAFAFGPLFMVSFFALYRYCQAHWERSGPPIALTFGIVATGLLTTMIVIQTGNWIIYGDAQAAAETEAAREAARATMLAVNQVQFLIDVVMDIFLCLATLLFAWALVRHGLTDRILGVVLGLLGLALLVLNMESFPHPPAESESFDAGPLLGVWYILVYVRLLAVSLRRGPVD